LYFFVAPSGRAIFAVSALLAFQVGNVFFQGLTETL